MDKDIKTDFPLAKRFIKKGEEIGVEDMCYLSSNTGDLQSVSEVPVRLFTRFGSTVSRLGIDSPSITSIIGQCALQDIEKYTPLTREMLGSCKEIKIAEKLKEIKNEQKESMKKRFTENEKEQEKLDALKETNDNIWL